MTLSKRGTREENKNETTSNKTELNCSKGGKNKQNAQPLYTPTQKCGQPATSRTQEEKEERTRKNFHPQSPNATETEIFHRPFCVHAPLQAIIMLVRVRFS